jgi:hypothetical protein
MSGVVQYAGVIDFGEYLPATGTDPAHPGYLPAPTGAQTGYIFSAEGWVSPASLGIGQTFESVSKNLKSVGFTLAYVNKKLSTVTYANGVIKTLNYTSGKLSSVVLSGATPAGITLTKTLGYTSGTLTSVGYS